MRSAQNHQNAAKMIRQRVPVQTDDLKRTAEMTQELLI